MVSESGKQIGFLLGFISLALSITCVALPDWRKNDLEGEVVELIRTTQGLWLKCVFFPTGNWQCEDHDRFFIALPAAIIGARVFSVFSIIFQVVALMLGPFGMACTLFYMDAPRTKHRLVLFSGTLSILAGVFIGVAVSWYAALVVNDYSRDVMNQAQGIDTSIQRYVYGRALYYGWTAMSLLFIQGGIQCCSSWGGESEAPLGESIEAFGSYPYAPQQQYNQPFIYDNDVPPPKIYKPMVGTNQDYI